MDGGRRGWGSARNVRMGVLRPFFVLASAVHTLETITARVIQRGFLNLAVERSPVWPSRGTPFPSSRDISDTAVSALYVWHGFSIHSLLSSCWVYPPLPPPRPLLPQASGFGHPPFAFLACEFVRLLANETRTCGGAP